MDDGIPDHLLRYPTRAAINSLARRFDIKTETWMQDWEWQVADPDRIDDFLAAYESTDLTDDERFTLLEMLIQSFEDLDHSLFFEPRWERLLALIDQNIELHIHTVWYWSVEGSPIDEAWRVTPFMREMLAAHRGRFQKPTSADPRMPHSKS